MIGEAIVEKAAKPLPRSQANPMWCCSICAMPGRPSGLAGALVAPASRRSTIILTAFDEDLAGA